MKKIIEVETGEVKAGKKVILRSEAIGSCVVIAAYDSKKKVGAMAHVMLPGRSPEDPALSMESVGQRTRYAADAIDVMIDKLARLGADRGGIEVCLVGGGNVLRKNDDVIWKDNIASVVGLLKEKQIKIKAEALGGRERRSISLDVERGSISYKEADGGEMLLWKTVENSRQDRSIEEITKTGRAKVKDKEKTKEPKNVSEISADDSATSAVKISSDKSAEFAVARTQESEKVQRASINIMEDLEKRKRELEESQKAYLKITEDMEKRTKELEESKEASLNIMEDMGKRSNELEEIQKVSLNIMGDLERQRKELDDAKAYVDNIIKNMIDTLIVIDPKGKIRTVNQATVKLLGYKEEELIGQPVATIFAEEEEEEEDFIFKGTRLKKLIEEGSVRDYDMTYKAKSGEKIPVSFSGSVMYESRGRDEVIGNRLSVIGGKAGNQVISNWVIGKNGKEKEIEKSAIRNQKSEIGRSEIVGIVGIARDMREIKRLMEREKELAAEAAAAEANRKRAAELEKAYKELEKSNKELKEATVQIVQSEKLASVGELTAGVTHELNQPLNGIKIICQSILRDIQKNRYEKEDLSADLEDVVIQVNKMSEIIDHMRVFTRLTAGMPREMIDVNVVIEGPFKILGEQLKVHNIEVIKELAPDLPKVIGDPIRLEQVFMNLITNARSAVDEAGEKWKVKGEKYQKKITISTNLCESDASKSVLISVSDNGVGIPEGLREKIFEPFFTTAEPGKGTGLGLSVTSMIIEEHGGRIELESQVGEGTTFKIILPVSRIEEHE